jgi:hypothetical protein
MRGPAIPSTLRRRKAVVNSYSGSVFVTATDPDHMGARQACATARLPHQRNDGVVVHPSM